VSVNSYAKIKEVVTSPQAAVKYAKELADAAKLYRAITEPGDDYWGQMFQGSRNLQVGLEATTGIEPV
jgi:hypothetical protein